MELDMAGSQEKPAFFICIQTWTNLILITRFAMKDKNYIKKFIEDICNKNGVILYNLTIANAPGRKKFTVFITKKGGVTIGDCSRISKVISEELDYFSFRSDVVGIETYRNFLADGYLLEVSSPGLERTLNNFEHFNGAVGEIVKITYHNKDGAKRTIKGKLQQVDVDKIIISQLLELTKKNKHIESSRLEIYFSDIDKAMTVFHPVGSMLHRMNKK